MRGATTRLSVNVDHVATVREARGVSEPSPIAAAVIAEVAGAQGITCHIRRDRRHIDERDLRALRAAVTTPLNVEMAATAEMLRIAREIRPDIVTLVPERPGEVTTEGGIDVAKLGKRLAKHVSALKRLRIRVSLFVDPEPQQIVAAAAAGAATIELNTNSYCSGRSERKRARAFDALVSCAALGRENGMTIAAGHGLTLENVRPVADVPEVVELNIGHSIVARSVMVGFERSVREMLGAMNG